MAQTPHKCIAIGSCGDVSSPGLLMKSPSSCLSLTPFYTWPLICIFLEKSRKVQSVLEHCRIFQKLLPLSSIQNQVSQIRPAKYRSSCTPHNRTVDQMILCYLKELKGTMSIFYSLSHPQFKVASFYQGRPMCHSQVI